MFEASRDNIKPYEVTVKYPRITVFTTQWIGINGKQGTIDGAGQSVCDKNDKFDESFGIALAGVRAEINMLKRYEEILIKLTKQPEWRKEKQATKEDFNECFKKAMIEMQTAVENFNKRFGIKE